MNRRGIRSAPDRGSVHDRLREEERAGQQDRELPARTEDGWDSSAAFLSFLTAAWIYASCRLFFGYLERACPSSGLACPSCSEPLLGRDYGETVRSTGRCPDCGVPALMS